jgi:HEAT repeat protein
MELLVASGVRTPEVRAGLRDPHAPVRAAAIRSLDPSDPGDRDTLLASVSDEDARVAATASALALGLDDAAPARLRELLNDPDGGVRSVAVGALRFAPAGAAADLASERLDDPAPAVRGAALDVLAATEPERARTAAVAAIRDPDPALRLAAGRSLGAAGTAALDDVLAALEDPVSAAGGILAVRAIEGTEAAERARRFAAAATERASRYRDAARAVPDDGPAAALLADALLDRGRRLGRAALWALTIASSDREAFETAIQNLDGAGAQVPAALEALDSAAEHRAIAPLLALWEPSPASHAEDEGVVRDALQDDDPLIRASAGLALEHRRGGTMTGSPTTALSLVERVIVLRTIPLLADLTPVDLERLAGFAEERAYTDGEAIAAQGELGEELHVVIDGEVRVVHDDDDGAAEVELARRGPGDVIGELSLITRGPRVASLVAAGDVRTIRIGRREFESLLLERPEVALAVMRVLATRVAERTHGSEASATR